MTEKQARVSVYVSVGNSSVFRVSVAGWPENTAATSAPEIFGSYWPPIGVSVIEESTNVEREFSVDLSSEDSLVRFESDFGLYVSEKLPGFVAVHAALLHVDDAVIIVPGKSGVGKSSLCVAAMEAGWEVWSDEYCLIDTTTGEVSGWPRPVRQRLPGGGVRRIDHQGPVGPGQATHVIAMAYSGDISGLALEPVSPGQVAMDLMANTVCARSRPEETFRATTRLAKDINGLGGYRGDTETSLAPLRMLLAESRPENVFTQSPKEKKG
jgi:hypothetical protein